jgi:hypothetical protein
MSEQRLTYAEQLIAVTNHEIVRLAEIPDDKKPSRDDMRGYFINHIATFLAFFCESNDLPDDLLAKILRVTKYMQQQSRRQTKERKQWYKN